MRRSSGGEHPSTLSTEAAPTVSGVLELAETGKLNLQ